MVSRIVDQLDQLVPPDLRGHDETTLWRSRLIVYFCLVLAAVALVYGPVFAWKGEYANAMAIVVATIADLSAIVVLWRTRSHAIAGTLPGFLGIVSLGGMSLLQGGVLGDVLYWSPVFILTAMLLAGRRGALVVVVTDVALVAGLVVVHELEVPLPTSPHWPVGVTALALAMVAVVTWGLASLFEAANDRMRAALERRNADMRYLLDNVGQGFLSADRSGTIIGDHSSVTIAWFGPPKARLWAWLGREDAAFAEALEVGWSQIWEDVLPIELCLDQLPTQVSCGGRTFGVEYRPVYLSDGAVGRVVVVVSDVTERRRAEQAEASQRELATALDRALRDRSGVHQFVNEVDAMFGRLARREGDARRILHTLKGNCTMFGIHSVAERCHQLETALLEHGEVPTPEAVAAARAPWDELRRRLAAVGLARGNVLELDRFRYQALREATQRHAPYEQLDEMVAALVYEPLGVALGRAADHARFLAGLLGRPEPDVFVDDGGLLAEPRSWEPFWASFVHAVRNAVDHGTRPGEKGRLTLTAARRGADVVIELADEGDGIAWDRVATRAASFGLPHATEAELLEALFVDGLSTLDHVNEVSGRGVGLGAFREAVRAMGGELTVTSKRGVGTRISAVLPGAVACGGVEVLRDTA